MQTLGGNEPREQISPLAGAHQHIGTFVIGGIDWPYKLWIYTRSQSINPLLVLWHCFSH